ncbi:ribonuclease H-like domain-containing protein [Lasiosphaeria miniovina]|uniref:RNA exonuclease 4 n=1 Tax=Lasiosphaeria miniovina TaxID=1954250 RepID=A0AA39ZQ46_9PEZI|nr:ribonuclease H-like domain-containing protein [Lasiosphaeria miniovina]KAK0701639.1 ribonuclease H-like domain-containing protein [Lasiosphaeria miniovina]
MAPELSSNWKKLQAKIKAESAPTTAATPASKRKASDSQSGPGPRDLHPSKRQKQPLKPGRSERPAPRKPSSSFKQAHPATSMGNTQSSKIDAVTKAGVSPSLALWAANNDISAEDMAEAYGLGLRGNAMLEKTAPARPNEGLAPGVEVGKYIAVDCEMVGIGEGGHDDALARVSLVDFHGRQVYDSFVRPQEPVVDWRTHVSGVSPKNMATARSFKEVQAQVAELLHDRILVGHDVKHDLKVLLLDHPPKHTRDTAKFSAFRKYGHGPKPALKVLAQELLGVEIQSGQHSSIEDARVTMLLFRKHKQAFDVEHASRYPDTAVQKFRNGKSQPKKFKDKK